ncbi:FAD/NAD(P)-binding protein [Roseobacter sp. A03A-229]
MTGHTHAHSHVIVGDGITALAFVEACALQAGETLTILGSAASQLGRGAAYAKGTDGTPWRYAYLLNSPADDIDPEFAQWLAARWPEVQETMAGRNPNWLRAADPLVAAGDLYGVNAPREFYGDFMEERASIALARLKAQGVQVTRRDDTARAIEVTPDGVILHTSGGDTIRARSVDIAPGGPSTMRIDGDDGPFSVPSVFGHEDRIAAHITRGAEIFCIGGNAAMLDVLRLCQSLIPDDALRFVACAPDGEIPAPLVPRLPRKLTTPKLSKGHPTADSLLAEIAREIERAKAAGDEMREIRAGFRAFFLEHPLTQFINDPTQARRVPGQLRFWLRGGTRDTILDMHRLVDQGKARVVRGLVKAVTYRSDGATVHIIDDHGRKTAVETGFVVNCAGAGPNSRYDPLTEDLIRQKLITICPITKGLRVASGCRTTAPQLRYLSPAVSEIGEEVIAMPLYDAHMLRSYVARAAQVQDQVTA